MDNDKTVPSYIDDIENEEFSPYYYMCGIDLRNGFDKRTVDFIVPYTDEELKVAMMEETLFHSADDAARSEMDLTGKQKFSQAFVLVMYRKKQHNITVSLFRSEKELSEEEIKDKIMTQLTEKDIRDAELPI